MKYLVVLQCENETSQRLIKTNFPIKFNHKIEHIMKKAILTIGLFSLVVLTSFSVEATSVDSGKDGEPVRTGGVNTDLGNGSAGAGNPKKVDFAANN